MATSSKKKRTKTARAPGGSVISPDAMPPDLIVAGSGPQAPSVQSDGEAILIETPTDDGMITIQYGEPEKPKKKSKFDDNLAETLAETGDGEFALGRIAEQLLEAIEQDERDRSEWLQQRADGLDLLGQKVERPGTGNVGSSATAVAGQSTVRDAILSEAVDMFQANAFAELCPSEGPCKVINYGSETADSDKLARDFEQDMNFYLTGSGPGTAKEYYPDTRRMLWWTGYASGMFKKVYACPLRRRPVSESVDGSHLIIPSNATDLHNAGRITHQIDMRQSTMRRMQILGEYRDVSLTAPTSQPNVLTQKEGTVTGLNPNPQREQDQEYTIYESYCELDIPGFEHKREGKETGLALPYRVTLDKDSRVILAIRRNWKEPVQPDDEEDGGVAEEDDSDLPVAKIPFVAFPYTDNMGIYGTGLLHRLGNYSMALTAMLRECIDAGMFASFPGFLYAKPAGRQLQNEFRVPPGGGAPIDVSTVGGDISRAVMPLPYKDVSTAMVALMQQTRENASRYGGMANTGVGEGKQDAPVGTTLALIEQATKIEGGVHKALHAAQKEELLLLKELFREDPDALWRGNRRPAMGPDEVTRRARFKQALETCELVPASDPNIPSEMHRKAKAEMLKQTATTVPGFDMKAVMLQWGAMMKIDNIDALYPGVPPQQDGPNPAMLKLAIDKQNADTKQMSAAQKAENDKAKIASQEQMTAAKLGQQHAAAMANGGPVAPDPAQQAQQDRALDLKAEQIADKRQETMIDAHARHADRNSKEAIEAMKIVSATLVHPDSAGVADEQMAKLSGIISPAATNNEHPGDASMADGGPVSMSREDDEALRAIKLAAEITKALQERSVSGYVN